MSEHNSNDVKAELSCSGGQVQYYSLEKLEARGYGGMSRLPVTIKILTESVLRHLDGKTVTEEHLENLIHWKDRQGGDISFKPARILMQDLTGVPAIVDLAAMRDAVIELGGKADRINPLIHVDLVIDHSVQVDRFGSSDAFAYNAQKEYQRNKERYEILNWSSKAFSNLTVVPPATGICHQVNLEYLSQVVRSEKDNGQTVVFPDTLLGTDSHTTMINGLGVLGWGVGGIEAEAALLGQPLFLLTPQVIGFRMTGNLNEGVTATDLVLAVTRKLREHGVVGRFVEYFGPALASLSLPDRATISNMCPEYGATAALFPVDDITLSYLESTARSKALVELVERYTKAQGMFGGHDALEPEFSEVVELDLGTVTPAIAGPKRPQDRIELGDAKASFQAFLDDSGDSGRDGAEATGSGAHEAKRVSVTLNGVECALTDGSVVIAAITSCTNTSNPSVLIAAGLLAKKAVEAGLTVPGFVKTSLAPGSRVVSRYLELSGLMPHLESLGFHLVGFGCTTCIGNSGPLHPDISRAVRDNDLLVVSVLSGNRNFEGRIHSDVRGNYLASPPLVVAYALAGNMNVDLSRGPVGANAEGHPVFLKDIWPSGEEIRDIVDRVVTPQLFAEEYGNVYTGNKIWNGIDVAGSELFKWDPRSTYIRRPPFFEGMTGEIPEAVTVQSARVLVWLGESVTTDHISPAGAISDDSPAAEWLLDREVAKPDFNTFGSRRGNHEIMIRGTFGNIRIRNRLVPRVEGGQTLFLPTGEQMPIYDAAMRYLNDGIPLIVLAGKDYGMGSSRDWAAKGTLLLGVRAVIVESFERIHRSNLIGMGVLPLQFEQGQTADSLGLTGHESFDIGAVDEPGQRLEVVARGEKKTRFTVQARIDTSVELDYYRNGGILNAMLRSMAG